MDSQPVPVNETPEYSPDHHIHYTLEGFKDYCDRSPNCPVDRELMHRFAFLVAKIAERANNSDKSSDRTNAEMLRLTKAVNRLTVVAVIIGGIALLLQGMAILYQVVDFYRVTPK